MGAKVPGGNGPLKSAWTDIKQTAGKMGKKAGELLRGRKVKHEHSKTATNVEKKALETPKEPLKPMEMKKRFATIRGKLSNLSKKINKAVGNANPQIGKEPPKVSEYGNISEIGKQFEKEKTNREELEQHELFIIMDTKIGVENEAHYRTKPFIRPSASPEGSFELGIPKKPLLGREKTGVRLDTHQIDVDEKGFHLHDGGRITDYETFEDLKKAIEIMSHENFIETTEDAEDQVYKAGVGDYRIRRSSDGKNYTLCLKGEGKILKFKFEIDGEKFKMTKKDGKIQHYDNLEHLISYAQLYVKLK